MANVAAASATTVPPSKVPVISPAAALLAPPAAASIGITETSSRKLVREANSARKVTANGPPTRRGGRGAWAAALGAVCVKLLMATTLGAKRPPGKVRFQ